MGRSKHKLGKRTLLIRLELSFRFKVTDGSKREKWRGIPWRTAVLNSRIPWLRPWVETPGKINTPEQFQSYCSLEDIEILSDTGASHCTAVSCEEINFTPAHIEIVFLTRVFTPEFPIDCVGCKTIIFAASNFRQPSHAIDS